MQSGVAKTEKWVLEYLSTSARVPEPLMGWTSSEDTLNQVTLKFHTCEEAVNYAEKQGWEYSVAVSREPKIRPRNYGDNFKYIPPAEEA